MYAAPSSKRVNHRGTENTEKKEEEGTKKTGILIVLTGRQNSSSPFNSLMFCFRAFVLSCFRDPLHLHHLLLIPLSPSKKP